MHWVEGPGFLAAAFSLLKREKTNRKKRGKEKKKRAKWKKSSYCEVRGSGRSGSGGGSAGDYLIRLGDMLVLDY